jgi:pyruvate/oxaloacetate carboxyltransferase
MAWSSQDFPNYFSKNINEHPWKRLETIKELFNPIPLKIPLMSKYLRSKRVFTSKSVSRFLDILKEHDVLNLRLFDPLNNYESLSEIMNLCLKRDFVTEGTIFINPLNPDYSPSKKLMEMYKNNGISNITLFEPTGTLNIKLTRKIIEKLKKFDELEFKLSISGKKENLSYIIGNFLESEVNITGIDVTSFLNYPEPGPPNILSVLSLLHELGIKNNIDMTKLINLQNELCLDENFNDDCNNLNNLNDIKIIAKKIPSYLVAKLNNVLEVNNKEKMTKEIMNEIENIQIDLGYPPLVPPFLNFVISQAVFNGLSRKKKYSTIVPELHSYLSGYYGEPPKNISKNLLEIKRHASTPPSINFSNKRKNIMYKDWKLNEEEKIAYEIATKEAEIFFLRKFGKIPDEIDLTNKKTLAKIVTKIIKHKDPIQSIVINNKKELRNNKEEKWALVGRLDQMGSKYF